MTNHKSFKFSISGFLLQKQFRRSLILFIMCLLLTTTITIVYFYNYNKVALLHMGQWDLKKIEYEDMARSKKWDEVIAQTGDNVIMKMFSNKDALVNHQLFGYASIPAHIMFKVFRLRGENLWFAQKLFLTLLGIGVSLLVFFICNTVYGYTVGMIAGLLTAFSPHLWISFNLSGGWLRNYNIFLSLLSATLFLLHMRKKRWYLLFLTGITLAINFHVFHIGSFMLPIIFFVYCTTVTITERKLESIKHFFSIMGVAVLAGLILSLIHSAYFNLETNLLFKWIQVYLSKGAESSHSLEGAIILTPHKILENFLVFVRAVFVNGNSFDWHYGIVPPGVPLVYSSLITVFFLLGCINVFKQRRLEDIFFLIWFIVFFFVHSFIVVMRLKNVLWVIFPIVILATRGASVVFPYIKQRTIMSFKIKGNIIFGLIFVLYSVFIGVYFIFYELPRKNFISNIGFMGCYPVYRYISEQGYTDRTKIVFTTEDADMLVGHLAMRFFTEDIPGFISLKSEGILCGSPSTTVARNILSLESLLLKRADKIYYLFNYWDDHNGYIYSTDEPYRESFVMGHPNVEPHLIKGPDGKTIWTVYEISKGNKIIDPSTEGFLEKPDIGMQGRELRGENVADLSIANMVSIGMNLVSNGDFLRDTSNWSAGNGAGLTIKESETLGKCLKITKTMGGSVDPYAYQIISNAKIGKLYKITLLVKKEEEATAMIGIGPSYTSGAYLPQGVESFETTDSFVQHEYLVKPTTTNIVITLFSGATKNGEGTLFDSVTCHEVRLKKLSRDWFLVKIPEIFNLFIRPFDQVRSWCWAS